MTATRGEARAELLAHLEHLADTGYPSPCRAVPIPERAVWTSDTPADQQLAARLCQTCPALAACGEYGTAYPKEAGVYGGLTETDRRKR
ncbi:MULTISPECIES: WhiB family transcriptional regulator [Actinomycetes]|uniref:WhiB family transcriptional regulator n=1 Tax=Actinotalea ferrariae CF5-4 TaxID=948458 RepID=A0A021VSG0_9CELL|nr:MULTISPECIES: WhiB family transcriptional regulator [Actinomycetes]EYR61997.1 WhiB family transcriptional regulator [Actinotalea ferrariae CF5-4]NHC47672.1 hypothetical protein [Motilibacter aurantiacus]